MEQILAALKNFAADLTVSSLTPEQFDTLNRQIFELNEIAKTIHGEMLKELFNDH